MGLEGGVRRIGVVTVSNAGCSEVDQLTKVSLVDGMHPIQYFEVHMHVDLPKHVFRLMYVHDAVCMSQVMVANRNDDNKTY